MEAANVACHLGEKYMKNNLLVPLILSLTFGLPAFSRAQEERLDSVLVLPPTDSTGRAGNLNKSVMGTLTTELRLGRRCAVLPIAYAADPGTTRSKPWTYDEIGSDPGVRSSAASLVVTCRIAFVTVREVKASTQLSVGVVLTMWISPTGGPLSGAAEIARNTRPTANRPITASDVQSLACTAIRAGVPKMLEGTFPIGLVESISGNGRAIVGFNNNFSYDKGLTAAVMRGLDCVGRIFIHSIQNGEAEYEIRESTGPFQLGDIVRVLLSPVSCGPGSFGKNCKSGECADRLHQSEIDVWN
jgi:hypothetical protein